MLYREIIAVCCKVYTKHIHTPCGQNVEFVNVKTWWYISQPLGLKWLMYFQKLLVSSTHKLGKQACQKSVEVPCNEI